MIRTRDSDSDSDLLLSIDLSTQSLTADLIDIYNPSNIILNEPISILFDKLPNENGQISPLVWLQSFDELFKQLSTLNYCKRIVLISGAAQQHGSLYLLDSINIFEKLNDSNLSLHDYFSNIFKDTLTPTWLDTSTTSKEMKYVLTQFTNEQLHQITGSKLYPRFTLTHIMKYLTQDKNFDIYLISSFFTSLFISKHSSIEISDASGMNLLDLNEDKWSNDLLKMIITYVNHQLKGNTLNMNQLIKQLGGIDALKIINLKQLKQLNYFISNYFHGKYHIPKQCLMIPLLADNIASFLSLNLTKNEIGISFGTSDTIFYKKR